ncbi:MAG: YigZ family protein [Marinilabiliaceae bacterium]|nr:YigZ family protein [Marinilabiliaceae bacterium]
MDEYLTIENISEGIYKEKGSKFLAFAHPVMSIEEIKEIIDGYKKEYFDARHHCYAWRLGIGNEESFRANDDGEPSGTAGKPIYGQILSNNLTNILVVVIRYFGGIKLGTSGLIYAYKTATTDALSQATIITRLVEDRVTVRFAYESMNDIMRIIKEENPRIINQDFDLMCSISMYQRRNCVGSLIERLSKFGEVV